MLSLKVKISQFMGTGCISKLYDALVAYYITQRLKAETSNARRPRFIHLEASNLESLAPNSVNCADYCIPLAEPPLFMHMYKHMYYIYIHIHTHIIYIHRNQIRTSCSSVLPD